jgi:hypothetical protein
MNNTSGINDCISIDSDYEGVASLSNSSVYNNVNSNDNLLRIVCLNCCGIKTRLQYPEFRNLIQSYNIVCFVETKTDDIDIITLPGYKFVIENRKTITKNRSGGIMVGFKDNLAKHIDIVNTDSKCGSNSLKQISPYFLVLYIYHQSIPNTHPNTILVNCNRNICLFQINLNIYVSWGTLT